jgi:hypothetical protein
VAGTAQAAVGPNGEPLPDPYTDPVTKENLKDWSDVVVLLAVRIDPEKTPEAGQSPDATGGGGATAAPAAPAGTAAPGASRGPAPAAPPARAPVGPAGRPPPAAGHP